MLSFHSVNSGQSLDTKHIYGPNFSEGDPLKESLCDTPANSLTRLWSEYLTHHTFYSIPTDLSVSVKKSLFCYEIFFGHSTQHPAAAANVRKSGETPSF